jgi:predicted dehydrogenase
MAVKTTRRQFVQTTAAVGVGYWVAGGVQAQESKSPNERVAIACIGVEGKGRSDSEDAGRYGDVVAICDIDEDRLGPRGLAFPKAKKYADFRKMLEEMEKSIDAVTVSTPDHTHAPASVMAMRMGKHCFCQKPLTHTIEEARLMGEIAREKKLITQMGNQGTAEAGTRRGAATIKSGALGTVKEVHVWTNRPIWPQGLEAPEKGEPVPSSLHWDLFLGPAKERPYAPVYHPFKWRGWWDFGTGALGDMACHTLNLGFMGLDLRDPTTVQAETSGHNHQSYPKWSIITLEFPERNGRPALKMIWYDGGKLPPIELLKGQKVNASGLLLIGDKDSLYSPHDYGAEWVLLSGAEKPEVEFERSPGHFREWIDGIKKNEQAMSNFPDYAGPLTETVLLGNLAVWVADKEGGPGKKVQWNAKELKPANAPEAESLVRKEYRKGFSIHEEA